MGLHDAIWLKKGTQAVYGKPVQQSAGKDLPTGHFELM